MQTRKLTAIAVAVSALLSMAGCAAKNPSPTITEGTPMTSEQASTSARLSDTISLDIAVPAGFVPLDVSQLTVDSYDLAIINDTGEPQESRSERILPRLLVTHNQPGITRESEVDLKRRSLDLYERLDNIEDVEVGGKPATRLTTVQANADTTDERPDDRISDTYIVDTADFITTLTITYERSDGQPDALYEALNSLTWVEK